MMRKLFTLLLPLAFGLVLGTAGCITMKAVDYDPQPAASERPAEDFIRLVMMAKRWKPEKIEVKKTFATLWYIGSDIPTGSTSVTIPYEEVAHIKVGTVRGHDVVRVTDADGAKLYEYLAMDMDKAKAFADAMSALVAADGDIEPEKTN